MTFVRKSFATALFAGLLIVPLGGAAMAAPPENVPVSEMFAAFEGDNGPGPNDFQAVDGKRFTDAEDRAAAQDLGYAEAYVGRSHGCLIFKHRKKNLYITQDVDGHNGGRWKMADSADKLGSKKTRMGTYDDQLNRIGD